MSLGMKEGMMFVTKAFLYQGTREQQIEQLKNLRMYSESGIAVTNVTQHDDHLSFSLASIDEMLSKLDMSAFEELKLGSPEWKDEFEIPQEILIEIVNCNQVDIDEINDVVRMLESKINSRLTVVDANIYGYPKAKETRNAFRSKMKRLLSLTDDGDFFHNGRRYIFKVLDERPKPFVLIE